MTSCSAANLPMLARASRVTPAVCGLAITLSNLQQRMVHLRRLLGPDVEAGARDLLRAQRVLERLLVVDVAARRGDEIGVLLHQAELARADHAARAVVERAVDRDEVRSPQQFVERDLGGAALGDRLLVEIGVVGQHLHVEQRAAQPRDAAADVAEPADADGAAVDVVADEGVAVLHRAFAQRVVGLDDLLRQHQHHGEHVRGDRIGVAAALVDHQHAGVGAVLDVDGVVAGAAGRDDQQVRRARQQILVDVVFRRQLVARRAAPGRRAPRRRSGHDRARGNCSPACRCRISGRCPMISR